MPMPIKVKNLSALGFLKNLTHYSPELFDSLYDIVAQLRKTEVSDGSEKPFPVAGLSHWVRTPEGAPQIPYGLFRAEPRSLPMPTMGPRTSVDAWYVEQEAISTLFPFVFTGRPCG